MEKPANLMRYSTITARLAYNQKEWSTFNRGMGKPRY